MTESQESLQDKIIRLSSKGHGVIDVALIYVSPDRMRKDSAVVRKHIDEDLAPSIAEKGLIQPPTIHLFDAPRKFEGSDQAYAGELIAGWCRLQACIALGLTAVPYNSRERLTPDQCLELELEENDVRLDMTWQDRALGIRTIHLKKKREASANGTTWGYRESGRLLGMAFGQICDIVKVAEALPGDPELYAASNVHEAMKILMARKEDAIISSIASGTLSEISITRPSAAAIQRLSERGISISPMATLSPVAVGTSSRSEPLRPVAQEPSYQIDLSQMLFNMDNRDWFEKAEAESVDLVYTDIPYGIDMDNLDFGAEDLERVRDAHDVEENVDQMAGFLKGAFKVLKPNKYCLFWYDIKHQEKLHQWALDAGFTVQPYPIVWCKEHPCRNRAAGTWWTKAIEYVFVCRKGTGTLRMAQTRNWILADGSAERKTQRNPFSKPFAVSKMILDAVTVPGDTVLDCYAGEGSLVRCALTMGRKILAVEKERHHFERLTEHVKKVISSLTRDKASFDISEEDE